MAHREREEVVERAPGVLLFGADGGGRVFGFDQRPAPWTVIGVEQIGMSLDSLRPLGSSFTEFWELMRRGED